MSCLKQRITIFNCLSHVLFCKRLNHLHSDCSLCSRVVIKDINLKSCISHNFSNIRPLNFNTVVKNLFVDAEIDCYNFDVTFPAARFEKTVKQRQNYCLLFESCNSPADLIKFFTQTMLRVYFSSLRNILQILMIVTVHLISIKKSLAL